MNGEQVRTRLEEVRLERRKLFAAMAELDKEVLQLREICPHDGATTYHPDPSGNNGSWRECDICGAEVPRW